MDSDVRGAVRCSVVFFSVFSQGTALFALSDALLLLRSKKGACQLANVFDCLLHFAFTSALNNTQKNAT